MKAALVVIFNHRYEKNIPKLETYYEQRFSERFYLVPFAPVETNRVIRIIENSYCFSGHMAQGAPHYKTPEVTHYVFVGDDLILNPNLDESTILDALNLTDDMGYIKSLTSADRVRFRWRWALTAYQALRDAKFNWRSELPDADEARKRFEDLGITFENPVPRSFADMKALRYPTKARTLKELYWDLKLVRPYLKLLAGTAASVGRASAYPLLAGYSDFVVVPAKHLDEFAHYCGVFAALNVFAEVAVPTALALACKHVCTELTMNEHFADLGVKSPRQASWKGMELWEDEIKEFCETFGFSWQTLMRDFPQDALYYHPIKLSQWK